jgi:hypothetical protein
MPNLSPFPSGGLNLEHSYKYRPLDDYLIDRTRWQRDKQQLIERAGLEDFVDPRKVLDELDEALHRQYLITNGNITEGKNPHVKFGKNGGFTLATPKQGESDAEPLQHFFPERSYVPLLEIFSTVNRYTHYVDELQHWQQRYHRSCANTCRLAHRWLRIPSGDAGNLQSRGLSLNSIKLLTPVVFLLSELRPKRRI